MTRDEWVKVSDPWKVIRAAATSSNARDAAVTRIIDTMLEVQLLCRHDSVGYQPFSVTGNTPMPGSGKHIDQAMLAAERYHPQSQWHISCGWLLNQMPARQAAAMLLQAARVRPSVMGETQWAVTARQMVENQSALLISLGMRHYVQTPFESVEALEVAARRARGKLREWLKDEKIVQVA